MLRCWNGGKHLLVDVAVINPLGADHRQHLVAGGVGAAATEYEKKKRDFYHEYQKGGRLADQYDFVPMIFESSGGVGSSAIKFANELERRRREKLCSTADLDPKQHGSNRVLTAVNVTVQRFNSHMILAREPDLENLQPTDRKLLSMSAELDRKNAKGALRRKEEQRPRRVAQQPNTPPAPP